MGLTAVLFDKDVEILSIDEKIAALAEKIKAENIPIINIVAYCGDECSGRTINYSAGALNCYSITKSFTATAVGFAADEGKLRLSDRAIDFFGSDELPVNLSKRWRDITLRHLLTHTVGLEQGILFEDDRYDRTLERDWIKRSFSAELPFAPGEKFAYSNSNYFLAAAIVRRAVGEDVGLYLNRKLFEPMEFGAHAFERSAAGDIMGATGLFVYTWDMWKLGYLYMTGGLDFKGQRLLSEEWVRSALTNQVEIEGAPRYGYSFGIDESGFTCSGSGGQILRVIPERKFIFAAHAAGEPDYGALLREYFDV
jgi:Beta-lactamase class C and other penicillin binding proteins